LKFAILFSHIFSGFELSQTVSTATQLCQLCKQGMNMAVFEAYSH